MTAEKYLEDSANMFDDFLKENDKNSVEAIKKYDFGKNITWLLVGGRSEAATKAKLDKVAEIKRINAQIMAIKRLVMLTGGLHFIIPNSEISRNEDQLSELLLYKEFLDTLAPPVSPLLQIMCWCCHLTGVDWRKRKKESNQTSMFDDALCMTLLL